MSLAFEQKINVPIFSTNIAEASMHGVIVVCDFDNKDDLYAVHSDNDGAGHTQQLFSPSITIHNEAILREEKLKIQKGFRDNCTSDGYLRDIYLVYVGFGQKFLSQVSLPEVMRIISKIKC